MLITIDSLKLVNIFSEIKSKHITSIFQRNYTHRTSSFR